MSRFIVMGQRQSCVGQKPPSSEEKSCTNSFETIAGKGMKSSVARTKDISTKNQKQRQ